LPALGAGLPGRLLSGAAGWSVGQARERAVRRRHALRWSTVMVHSAPRRPPRLEKKALQAKGF